MTSTQKQGWWQKALDVIFTFVHYRPGGKTGHSLLWPLIKLPLSCNLLEPPENIKRIRLVVVSSQSLKVSGLKIM